MGNIQVRHRRICREARAPKELSSARLCDPPEEQLSAGDTPAESCSRSSYFKDTSGIFPLLLIIAFALLEFKGNVLRGLVDKG